MAEIILAILCIIVGLACGIGAVIVLWANAIGGVTAAYAVDNWPALFLAIGFLAGIGSGLWLLFT